MKMLREALILVLIACAVFGVMLGINLAFVGERSGNPEAMP
jgi:hypothetical protein